MKKDNFYELCRNEERHFKKLYDTMLLSELLRINYEYSTQEYYDITGNDILENSTREEYSTEEKEEIIKNAIILLNIKYNYPIRDDVLEQFNNLDFKRT